MDANRGWGDFLERGPDVKGTKFSPAPAEAEDEDAATVRRMNAAGAKDATIARALGCSATWVSQLRRRMGLPRSGGVRGARWSGAEMDAMGELVDMQRRLRAEVRAVAAKLGRTPRAVQEKLKELAPLED